MLRGNNAAALAQLEREWSNKKAQKLYTAYFRYSQDDSSSFETLQAEIDSSPGQGSPGLRVGIMLLNGNIDAALDLWEQYMDASEYLAMFGARNLPINRLLFPELYEHPRYRAMLRKHRLDDESIAQLKVSPLSF